MTSEMQNIISNNQEYISQEPQTNYGQPIVDLPSEQEVDVINNQFKEIEDRPGIPVSVIDSSMPHELKCPFCHKMIFTEVETTCNMGSCCLCFWLSCIRWVIILLCMGKEIGCADATHRCPECKANIGNYRSC